MIKLSMKYFLLAFFLLSTSLCSCGSSSVNVPAIDADQDGVLDDVDLYPNDTDNDGIQNGDDNCIYASNVSQKDSDGDGIGDVCDNCPGDSSVSISKCINLDQSIPPNANSCWNYDQKDSDGDGIGDVCDNCNGATQAAIASCIWGPSSDAPAGASACWNQDQSDLDENAIGDICDAGFDSDQDGFADVIDEYPHDSTRAGDQDNDGIDGIIDPDIDGDCYPNQVELDEMSNQLSPQSTPSDSDRDCLTDIQEIAFGSDPFNTDSDGDGLNDDIEYGLQLDPNSSDTDNDGIDDGVEVGSDHAKPKDYDNDGVIDASDYSSVFAFRALEANLNDIHDRFGVSVDADGNVYIANYPEGRIDIFSINGELRDSYTGVYAEDLIANHDGTFTIADTANDRIVLTDSLWSIVRIFEYQSDGTPGGFLSPKGVDVGIDGDIYVADTWNNRIQKYDISTMQWSASDAVFLDPQDVAVSNNGVIAVADTGHFNVQILNQNYGLVTIVDSASLGLSPFDFRPRSVAFSPISNELYIVDDASSRIVVVNGLDGRFLRSFGSAGTGVGEFLYPCGIFVNNEGKVFITDRYRLQVF